MSEIKLNMRYPESRLEDVTDAYMRGFEVGLAMRADENAKLRELVLVVVYCMQYERECDGCRLNGADGTITAPVGCDGLLDRMSELGVEV